jgi:hypothetical protein
VFHLSFNEVSASLRVHLPTGMAKFPQMFHAAGLFADTVRAVALRPSYVRALDLLLRMGRMLENLEYAAISYFSSGAINTVQMTKFQKCGKWIRTGATFSKWTALASLYPLAPFKVPPPIDGAATAAKRADVADLISEYRIAKNDLTECLLLRENSNLESVAERVRGAATRILALLNFVVPQSKNGPAIPAGFAAFADSLPRLFGYRLAPTHLREALSPLDAAVDRAVAEIAEALYAVVTPARLAELAARVSRAAFAPAGRQKFVTAFLAKLSPRLGNAGALSQVFFDCLQSLEDNEVAQVAFLVQTLEDDLQAELAPVLAGEYPAYAAALEGALEGVAYSDIALWFRTALETVVAAFKADDANLNAVRAVEALVADLELRSSIELIARNVKTAASLFKHPQLAALEAQLAQVQAQLPLREEALSRTHTALASLTDLGGAGLIFNPAVRQLLNVFNREFRVQDWPAADLITLCDALTAPLAVQYEPSAVADSLVNARRLMRRIRLTRPSVQASFVTEADRLLTRLEGQLREHFIGKQRQQEGVLVKQQGIVNEFVETFRRLPESNTITFVVKLMRNLSLDITTAKGFDAGGISRSVAQLFEQLSSSKDRAVQFKALLVWMESVATGVLPVDYDRVIGILRDLLARMDETVDEGLFTYGQDDLVAIAVQFSDAIAALNNLRHAVSLVRDVHKLYSVRSGFLNALTTMMRALQAYAEEIQTSPAHAHPLLGIIKSIPIMCTTLADVVEDAFTGVVEKGKVDEASAAVVDFIESCPVSIKETMGALLQGPTKLLADALSG